METLCNAVGEFRFADVVIRAWTRNHKRPDCVGHCRRNLPHRPEFTLRVQA